MRPRVPIRRSITPVNTANGLSSALNRDFVLQIFGNSTPEEIEEILRQARFRPRSGDKNLQRHHREGAVDLEVGRYLRTPEGVQELSRRMQEAMKQEAAKWLAGAKGQAELKHLKSTLLSKQLLQDGEFFSRSCREEIDREISRWLKSPQGQEAVEFQRKRILDQQARQPGQATKSSWIDHAADGVRQHG